MSLITAINKLDYIICCNFHFKPCSFLSKFLAPYLNWQISVSMAFFDNFAGIEFLINALKGMQMLSGSISITHASNEPLACIELVTELFQLWFWDISLTFFSGEVLFVSFGNCSFGDFPSKAKLTLSSNKLIKEGFSFKYGIEDI